MNKLKKVCLATALFTTLGITACNSNNNSQNSLTEGGVARPLTIFNAKGENALEFENLASAYYDETGIQVNVFSVGMGEDHTTPLSTEMTSSSPPHIFTIQGVKELADWSDGGFILDLATIHNHPEFETLVNDIPQELRLTTDGVNNFGIPYNIEGYGYIVDTQMLNDLFEDADIDILLEDIRLATYEEWEQLITTLDTYIENPSSATVYLNATQYTLRNEKAGVAENLTGVFASMGAESWTYGDHFVNVALNSVFANASDAYQASSEQFNSSIPMFVPMYYAINATLSEEEQLMAMDFLLWLNTSETGQDFIVNQFAFIPYSLDIESTQSIGLPLGDSLISYINKGAILGAPWQGSPGPWGSDIFGNGIMERYMIKSEWTNEDYNDIAEFGISSWQSLLTQ